MYQIWIKLFSFIRAKTLIYNCALTHLLILFLKKTDIRDDVLYLFSKYCVRIPTLLGYLL